MYATEVKGKRIGVISFAEEEFNLATENAPGANFFDVYESPEYVAECKKNCDFLIVLYHGGIEHYRYPSKILQKKCKIQYALFVKSRTNYILLFFFPYCSCYSNIIFIEHRILALLFLLFIIFQSLKCNLAQ